MAFLYLTLKSSVGFGRTNSFLRLTGNNLIVLCLFAPSQFLMQSKRNNLFKGAESSKNNMSNELREKFGQ